MERILLLQLLGHILVDFFFQPESWSISKHKDGFHSRPMYYHAAVVLLVSAGMTFSVSFIPYAAAIAATHLIFDLSKSILENYLRRRRNQSFNDELYSNPTLFIIDQALHIAVIYIAVLIYAKNNPVPGYIDRIPTFYILLPLIYLLCLKPANVLIRVFLSSLHLSIPDPCETSLRKEDLERAGRWIGSMERTLAFILVLLGEYTAIGFIIAAKSILRYNDKMLGKTEYVLIGTLMSFGIAILLGLGIREGIFFRLLDFVTP